MLFAYKDSGTDCAVHQMIEIVVTNIYRSI